MPTSWGGETCHSQREWQGLHSALGNLAHRPGLEIPLSPYPFQKNIPRPKCTLLVTVHSGLGPGPPHQGAALANGFPPGPGQRWGWTPLLMYQVHRACPRWSCRPVPSHSCSHGTGGSGFTSSVSYMVLLEENGEGSGSRSSHGLSVDSSRSSAFCGAVSHCVPLDWGFRVTTTLPGHRSVTL